MSFITFRALWAEAVGVILADVFVLVVVLAETSVLAKSLLVIGTHLNSRLWRSDMAIVAVVSLLAMPVLLIPFAGRNFVFLV